MANKKPTGQSISEVPEWACWDEARCLVRCESCGSLCAVVVQTKREARKKGTAAVPFAGVFGGGSFFNVGSIQGRFIADNVSINLKRANDNSDYVRARLVLQARAFGRT